jgi:glycerophosphoryl diester phosphodiesterase
MIKMLNMAVDGIITDYPDRLVKIRKDIRKIHSDRKEEEEEEEAS